MRRRPIDGIPSLEEAAPAASDVSVTDRLMKRYLILLLSRCEFVSPCLAAQVCRRGRGSPARLVSGPPRNSSTHADFRDNYAAKPCAWASCLDAEALGGFPLRARCLSSSRKGRAQPVVARADDRRRAHAGPVNSL